MMSSTFRVVEIQIESVLESMLGRQMLGLGLYAVFGIHGIDRMDCLKCGKNASNREVRVGYQNP